MPYQKLRLNITSTGFPLLSEFSGRTVIIPNLDENDQTPVNTGLVQANPEKRNPALFYCHDVMPTAQGLKSVGYDTVVASPALLTDTYLSLTPSTYSGLSAAGSYSNLASIATNTVAPPFSQIIEVRDANENITYVGITHVGLMSIKQISTNNWVELSSVGSGTGGIVTSAIVLTDVGLVTLLCIPGAGIFTVDLINSKLVKTALLGDIVPTQVLGITSAYNYLIVHDAKTVQWSSAFNPLDFTLSLAVTSGTGAGTPSGIAGIIVAITPTSGGFLVHTTANVVSAKFSGNIQYPWVFDAIPNSAGISNAKEVTGAEDAANYAWTSSGLMKISATGAVNVFPEVTDFLAGRAFEDYDMATNVLTTTYTNTDTVVGVRYIGKRFLCISYGQSNFSYALIYDIPLRRWGKLKLDHVDACDINISGDVAGIAKRTIGFLLSNGAILTVNWDLGNYSANGVAILGKIQLTRSNATGIHDITVENVNTANNNFSLKVGTCFNGKDINYPLITPYLADQSLLARHYAVRSTGQSHLIFMTGAFNLVSAEIIVTNGGNR